MIAVLDYGIGNLASAAKALAKVGADVRLCSDREQAAGAAGIVVPGVGAFGACMSALRSNGLAALVLEAAASGMPTLGICVGLQMLLDGSDEDPDVAGLGILSGRVRQIPDGVKRPQMQWNRLEIRTEPRSRMLGGLEGEAWVYFVHSYAPVLDPKDKGTVVATCDYGGEVVAAIERDSVWGCQFHPEKSGPTGLAILARFAALCG
jgi:glutamine amidotransferase